MLPDLHISQEAGQVVWYSYLFQNFLQFTVIHTVKGFGIVNKGEIYIYFFMELSCFFHDPANVGNMISDSSAFWKTRLNMWKFMVHVLLKPGLENFEYYFTYNCQNMWCDWQMSFHVYSHFFQVNIVHLPKVIIFVGL